MTAVETLVTRIEDHCATRNIKPSTFGRLAVNDGKLIERLRSGGSITLNTLQRIEAALHDDNAQRAQ